MILDWLSTATAAPLFAEFSAWGNDVKPGFQQFGQNVQTHLRTGTG
jgi:hypothetical protein